MVWLTPWNRRKSKTITGSTVGPQTDYQMKLTLYRSVGTDTLTDIYLGTNVNNNFSDIRFTSPDGSTLLSYWIETLTINVSAVVWIKIPSIPVYPGTTDIYIYYDNIVATSQSNRDNTLVFFDDFESGTIDSNKWATQLMYGSMGIRTDVKYGAYSIGSDQGPGQGCCYPGPVNPDQNHYFMKLPDGSDIQYLVSMKTIRWYTTPWYSYVHIGFGGANIIYRLIPDNVWRNYDIILKRTNSSNINYQIAINGVWQTPDNIAITQSTTLLFGVQTMHYGPSDNSVYVRSDDFRVRKYVSPEPTFGTTGTESTTGALDIRSHDVNLNPIIDAYIFINDVIQPCVTPCVIGGLAPGYYNVRLEKSGYINTYSTEYVPSGITKLADLVLVSETGTLDIYSTPPDAEIMLAPTGTPLVDQGIITPNTISLSPGTYDYKLTHIDYYDYIGSFSITGGQTTTLNITMSPLPCPVSIKTIGDTIDLKATPVQGVAPYIIEFRRSNSQSMADVIDIMNVDAETYIIPSNRLTGSNPVTGVAEGTQTIRTYTITSTDLDDATSKSSGEGASLLFGSKMIDSCTPQQICVKYCKILVACPVPSCDFTVS